MKVEVDLMTNNGIQGEVANRMNSEQLSPGAMRPYLDMKTGQAFVSIYRGGKQSDPKSYSVKMVANATLRRDEWKSLDQAVIMVAETRLNGIKDLISRGLVFQLGNAMGTTVLEWHDVSDALSAELSMDGLTKAENDRPNFQHNYLPIPIIHADYEINTRALMASRNMGNGLDTTLAERAARKVNEKLEQMLFTATSYGYGELDSRSRNSIYSYINFPDRNQYTLTTAWDASGKTAAQIRDDVLGMKQDSIDSKFYGPWVLYLPTAYETVLDNDYDTSGMSTQTIRERLLKISGISDIKIIDTLPANNIVLVQMTSDVVRLIRGMGISNVQWKTEGNFINKFKVMTIQVPQIRSDQNGNTGIVHASV